MRHPLPLLETKGRGATVLQPLGCIWTCTFHSAKSVVTASIVAHTRTSPISGTGLGAAAPPLHKEMPPCWHLPGHVSDKRRQVGRSFQRADEVRGSAWEIWKSPRNGGQRWLVGIRGRISVCGASSFFPSLGENKGLANGGTQGRIAPPDLSFSALGVWEEKGRRQMS